MQRRQFITYSAATLLASLSTTPAFAKNRKGKFKGDSGHTVTGGVTVKDGEIKMASNFNFDGAPDPRVALGKRGKFSKNTDFAVLKKDKGSQTYKVPARIDVSDYDSVIIWCRKYSVQLAHARIK